MTFDEILNKLSTEMSQNLGGSENLPLCRYYIQMALVIGIEHFDKQKPGIIAISEQGTVTEFRNNLEASRRLGMHPGKISNVLNGIQHTTHGYIFLRPDMARTITERKRITI